MFSSFAVSVAAEWQIARASSTHNELNSSIEKLERDLQAKIENTLDIERKCDYAILFVLYAIRVQVDRGDREWASRLAASSKQLAVLVDHPNMSFGPVYPHISPELQTVMDASPHLRARLTLALSLTLDVPAVPDRDQLVKGVSFMLEAYRALPRPLSRDNGSSQVLQAIVCALLARRTDLARELITLRKSQSSFKRQFAMLSRLAAWLEKHPERADELGRQVNDPKLQRAFFEIFNAYRILVSKDSSRALGEEKVGTDYSLVDAYLYSWLYLLYFAPIPRSETTWDEMTDILTA